MRAKRYRVLFPYFLDLFSSLFLIPRYHIARLDATTLHSSSFLQVAGFNLSFFASEHELIERYMQQLLSWLENGEISAPEVSMLPMRDIQRAHQLIQSGMSIGKIVCKI